MIRIREDLSVWKRRDAELPRLENGQLAFIDDNEDGIQKMMRGVVMNTMEMDYTVCLSIVTIMSQDYLDIRLVMY